MAGCLVPFIVVGRGEEIEVGGRRRRRSPLPLPSPSSAKAYCPFCVWAKQLLTQLESDGSEIQSALAQWTGLRTVPSVFIGGKHIGGCDNMVARHNAGTLMPLFYIIDPFFGVVWWQQENKMEEVTLPSAEMGVRLILSVC